MEIEQVITLANQIGFDHVGIVNMDALKPLAKVRDMCSHDKCNRYGKTWSCPPACGSLDHAQKRIDQYQSGVLVQSTCHMVDDFDFESMKATEKDHKEKFQTLVRQTRFFDDSCLPLASGSCTICHKCTYPDRPCRYPKKMFPSMEAYGLWVSDVCVKSDMPYNYGPKTTTYTACLLINKRDIKGK